MTAINAFRDMLNNPNLSCFFTNVTQIACLNNYVILSDVHLTLDSLFIEDVLLAFSYCFPLSLSWKRGTDLPKKMYSVNEILQLKDTSCPIQVLAAKFLLQIVSCVRTVTLFGLGGQHAP